MEAGPTLDTLGPLDGLHGPLAGLCGLGLPLDGPLVSEASGLAKDGPTRRTATGPMQAEKRVSEIL
jgi:hypothetical protein